MGPIRFPVLVGALIVLVAAVEPTRECCSHDGWLWSCSICCVSPIGENHVAVCSEKQGCACYYSDMSAHMKCRGNAIAGLSGGNYDTYWSRDVLIANATRADCTFACVPRNPGEKSPYNVSWAEVGIVFAVLGGATIFAALVAGCLMCVGRRARAC